MWQGVVIVAAGGSLGAICRYGMTLGVQRFTSPEHNHLATFAVNALGCLAFGFVIAVLDQRMQLNPHYRLALLTGLLGAFTTFSTYAYDSVALLHQGRYLAGGLNLAGQVVLGMAFVIAGLALGARVAAPAAGS